MNKKYIRYILEVLFFAVLVAIDLGSKALVFDLLENKSDVEILHNIFSFHLARNTGASFSILSGQLTFLTIMPIIAIVGIIAMLVIRPNTPKNLRIGAILIAAGALGNLIDRLALGYVRDFINYDFLDLVFTQGFAIGNIADLFLLIGVVVIAMYVIFEFQETDFYSQKKLQKLQEEEKALEAEVKDGE